MKISFLLLSIIIKFKFIIGVNLSRKICGGLMMDTSRSVTLPELIIVGYANWNQCDDKIIQAVKDGVNVIIWFSVNLAVDSITGRPKITNGPDWDCVANITHQIRESLHLETVHLISIGGWNSPHPDTSVTSEEMYTALNDWNRNIIARPELGWYGFDGFDWDIEGNDDFASKYNTFTTSCLDMMGQISQLAKRDKYIVAMAPAESYLDPTRPTFDRSLTHTYTEWEPIVPGFAYHGLNTYAYLLVKYGTTEDVSSSASLDCALDSTSEGGRQSEETSLPTVIPTFDFVTVQLYEGYSHAQYQLFNKKQNAIAYFKTLLGAYYNGYEVDFSQDSELNPPMRRELVQVPPQRLVIGLANGWAGDGKFFFISPEEVEEIHAALVRDELAPRGYAYWNMKDEGLSSPLRPDAPVWFAAGLNKFLKTRP